MGNQQSLARNIPTLREQEWQLVQSQSPDHEDEGWYRSLRHLETGQLVDQYEVAFIDQHDYMYYLDSFNWRLKEPEIVKTMYLKEEHREEFCSKVYSAKVYIQHIQTRLSDITDIPYPENLYVALTALDGFHKLYDNLQYFRVEENLICVDENGYVRVWIASDLSKNYPNSTEDAQNGDETTMVQQIMEIVTENTDRDSEPQSLKGYFFEQGNKIGFEQAKIIISEYARKHNAQIPEYFESILEIYRKQDESQDGEQYSDQMDSDRITPNYQNTTAQPLEGKTSNFHHSQNHINNSDHAPSHQPWNHNNGLSQPNANSDAHLRTLDQGEFSHSNKNYRSIPNLHSFQASSQGYSMGNAAPSPLFHHQRSRSNLAAQKQFSAHLPQQFGNPLGFQPIYNSSATGAIRPLAVIPQRLAPLIQPRTPSRNRYQSVPVAPFQQVLNSHNTLQSSPKIDRMPLLNEARFSDKNVNPRVNVMPPPIAEQEILQNVQSSKHSWKQLQEHRSDSMSSRNRSMIRDQELRVISENERVTASNAFSQQNNRSQHISRSRDIRDFRTTNSFSQDTGYIHSRGQPLPHVRSSYNQRQDFDTTFYYTLDTEEELDPEIAADLKKMFSNLSL